ncbi:MAG: ABC transporter permease [Deltaproteobacteria bacterium]|nr:MAG: ABC transporter permease [Deltaproteobacteria bacterium]
MNGPGLVSLAWRNLWRQKRRTILTLISIAFGGFLAVMMTAMQDRSFADFIDNAARFGAGHVTIQHPEYRDRPTLTRSVTDADAVREEAEADRYVVKVVDRTSGQAMLATAKDSFGAFFIAYDPALETEDTMEFTQGLVAGKLFESADDKGIILGHVLAKNLGAELGDKVVYTLTDRSGEIVSGMQRLTGIVNTGSVSTDAALMLLPIGTVRDVIGYEPNETTQVAVFLEDGRNAPGVAMRLGKQVGDDKTVLTWDELQPEIKAFVAMKIGGGRVFEIVIGVLVAAGIFNTIFMSVLERTREFGIMLAIGYSPRQVFSMVMWESVFLAGLGLLGAIAVTALPYWYMHGTGIDLTEVYAQQGGVDIGGVGMDPILRIGIYPENALIIALAIVGATILAGVYPAWRAGRVDPVESINLV